MSTNALDEWMEDLDRALATIREGSVDQGAAKWMQLFQKECGCLDLTKSLYLKLELAEALFEQGRSDAARRIDQELMDEIYADEEANHSFISFENRYQLEKIILSRYQPLSQGLGTEDSEQSSLSGDGHHPTDADDVSNPEHGNLSYSPNLRSPDDNQNSEQPILSPKAGGLGAEPYSLTKPSDRKATAKIEVLEEALTAENPVKQDENYGRSFVRNVNPTDRGVAGKEWPPMDTQVPLTGRVLQNYDLGTK